MTQLEMWEEGRGKLRADEIRNVLKKCLPSGFNVNIIEE
jgi:hypothetical protein